MWLRKKRRTEGSAEGLKILKKYSVKINARIKSFCEKLSAKTEHYSASKKKTALVIFCILFSSLSIYIGAQSILQKQFQPRLIFIQPVKIPSHIGKNKEYGKPNSEEEMKSLLKKMEAYQNLVDSPKNENDKPAH